jgi:NDP-sugar pyrophosphorylase family protein
MNPAAAPDVAILCGGLGTRLQSAVPDRPKALASVQGMPFLQLLVDSLKQQGLRRFIFCVGHLREQIIAHFAKQGDADYAFSIETSPLGTGGAVRNALPLVRSDPFLVLNGDSICSVDYAALLDYHRRKAAELTLVAAPVRKREDGGNLLLGASGEVTEFREKLPLARAGLPGLINAGIYAMKTSTAHGWHFRDPFSMEREVIPELVTARHCYGFRVESDVIDIGTPERYQDAQTILRR